MVSVHAFCWGPLRFAQMPGVRPGGRLTFLLHGKKVSKETCPAASVPKSFALRIFWGNLRSEQTPRAGSRRAVELPPRQGAPVKQLPRVRARSLAVLRQPNRRRLLRSQALAERGGEGHPEQPNSRTAEQPNSRTAEQPNSQQPTASKMCAAGLRLLRASQNRRGYQRVCSGPNACSASSTKRRSLAVRCRSAA